MADITEETPSTKQEAMEEVDLMTEEVIEEEANHSPKGCGILGRYPVLSVLLFAGVGIGVGVGLSYWDPDDSEDKDKTIKWIGLIGDLFIRALKCVVLPLVFINVVISVVDMMTVGKAGSIGWKTIGLYLLTTVIASILGIFSILMFKGKFSEGDFDDPTPATIKLGCNAEDMFLTEQADGSVMCSTDMESSSEFMIEDVSGAFVTSTSGPKNDISLSDTVYDGVFRKLVPSNIFETFVDANFAAVVMFAIVFGVALARVFDRRRQDQSRSLVMNFFKELDEVFITLINWIIACTPFAVLSLIASAIGKQDGLSDAFSNVGFLVVATIIAMALHVILVHFVMFGLVTKSSPFEYLKHVIPAQTMAFASASSAATIPVTLQSVKSTGKVPDHIARFVVPLGATVNMDGGAIYFPCACIWLAILNGIQPDVSSYFLLVIISTIGSAGTAPVPSASLVLIITAYNTVFNTTGTPEGFSFILAIDWFMDRLRTVTNVTGDTVVSGMVSHLCSDATEEDIKKAAGSMEDSSSEDDAKPTGA